MRDYLLDHPPPRLRPARFVLHWGGWAAVAAALACACFGGR